MAGGPSSAALASISQRTRLGLTPALRSALHVLRLSAQDLIDEVAAEAADNPFVLVGELRTGLGGQTHEILTAQRSLVADIRHQLALMPLRPEVMQIAAFLAGDLREDGYLDTPLAEMARHTGLEISALQEGLAALQMCEPVGVGARTLAECLALQLVDRGVKPELAQSIVAHLDLFAVGNWRALGRALDMSQDALLEMSALIQTLAPHPVVAGDEAVTPLLPDVALEPDGFGGFLVRLAIPFAAQVRLNRSLIRASRQETSAFAPDRQARAEALVRAIRLRGRTLLRICRCIAEHQHGFLTQGPDHLRPLSRVELASALSLHPSTVGRAVAAKALTVGGRVYPLSFFFSSALTRGSDSPAFTAFVVQRSISRLIQGEDPDNPLSDSAISDLLMSEGVDIARRTVAKYRGCMRIPPSFARRNASARSKGCLSGPFS